MSRHEDHGRSLGRSLPSGQGGGGAAGSQLRDLVEEGLRLVLETPRESGRRRSLAALMKGTRGAVGFRTLFPIPSISRISLTMRAAIVDTGPLVAFLDRAEQHHRWVAEQIEQLDTPLLLCEPVLAEAMHPFARFSRAHDALFGLLKNGALMIAFHIDEHVSVLRKLHQEYRDRPMSLADACNCADGRNL
jgi:uncharacterized protein